MDRQIVDNLNLLRSKAYRTSRQTIKTYPYKASVVRPLLKEEDAMSVNEMKIVANSTTIYAPEEETAAFTVSFLVPLLLSGNTFIFGKRAILKPVG